MVMLYLSQVTESIQKNLDKQKKDQAPKNEASEKSGGKTKK